MHALGKEVVLRNYLEAQTRDAKRTDVVVDCLGEQFVVEMKIVEAVV